MRSWAAPCGCKAITAPAMRSATGFLPPPGAASGLLPWLDTATTLRGVYTDQAHISGGFANPDGTGAKIQESLPSDADPANYGGRFTDLGIGISAESEPRRLCRTTRCSVEWLKPIRTEFHGSQNNRIDTLCPEPGSSSSDGEEARPLPLWLPGHGLALRAAGVRRPPRAGWKRWRCRSPPKSSVRNSHSISRYRPDSLISEINRVAATGGEIEVDAETAGLFDYADTCYRQSDGLFDITSGVLRRAWRFDHGELPDQSLIDELLEMVGWDKLRWHGPHLSFPLPGMEIDLGGVVKEYAADRAATVCTSAGLHSAIVNLGGDIRIVGPRPDGSPWIVGLQHPREKDALLQNMEIYQGGLATSGDYERCIEVDGERYSHILNPRTGWPVRHLATVSVVGDFCLIAGSASTIGMLKEADGPQWLQDLGLPHVWMDATGRSGGRWTGPVQ